jgi:hypothetical protein
MLKIEKDSDGQTTFIRLIGRIQSEDLGQLQTQMDGNVSRVLLDLDEVTLVDLEVVRFLSGCMDRGVELARCSPYIREWILREQVEGGKD